MGRSQLQSLLEEILGSDEVHFQPPTNVEMAYPAIVYHWDFANTEFADSSPYRFVKRYMVTHIDRDPDSPIPDQLARLPMCTFNRSYTSEDLHHSVFNLFFN
jgi:hypothetical protein